MRRKITQAELAKLPLNAVIHDREIKGFVARELISGTVTFGFRYCADGRHHWCSLGKLDTEITLDEARRQAKIKAGMVADGSNPAIDLAVQKEVDANLVVGRLAEIFLAHKAKTLRPNSLYEMKRIFARSILPAFGTMQIGDIKRSDVVRMLDKIEGDAMSNQTLAIISIFFNWHARRSDDFESPVTRKVARNKTKGRDRILDDDELAELWAELDNPTVVSHRFADLLRLILLTAQRPGEVAAIESHEIEHAMWRMPAEKNKTGVKYLVPLSQTAQIILAPYLGHPGHILSMGRDRPAPDDTRSMRTLRAALNERR